MKSQNHMTHMGCYFYDNCCILGNDNNVHLSNTLI